MLKDVKLSLFSYYLFYVIFRHHSSQPFEVHFKEIRVYSYITVVGKVRADKMKVRVGITLRIFNKML